MTLNCVEYLICANITVCFYFNHPGILQNKKRSRTEQEHQSPAMALFRMSTACNSNESLLNKSTGDEMPMEPSHEDHDRQAPKRLALQDSNIPRYEKEFVGT